MRTILPTITEAIFRILACFALAVAACNLLAIISCYAAFVVTPFNPSTVAAICWISYGCDLAHLLAVSRTRDAALTLLAEEVAARRARAPEFHWNARCLCLAFVVVCPAVDAAHRVVN